MILLVVTAVARKVSKANVVQKEFVLMVIMDQNANINATVRRKTVYYATQLQENVNVNQGGLESCVKGHVHHHSMEKVVWKDVIVKMMLLVIPSMESVVVDLDTLDQIVVNHAQKENMELTVNKTVFVAMTVIVLMLLDNAPAH